MTEACVERERNRPRAEGNYGSERERGLSGARENRSGMTVLSEGRAATEAEDATLYPILKRGFDVPKAAVWGLGRALPSGESLWSASIPEGRGSRLLPPGKGGGYSGASGSGPCNHLRTSRTSPSRPSSRRSGAPGSARLMRTTAINELSPGLGHPPGAMSFVRAQGHLSLSLAPIGYRVQYI